MFDQFTYGYLGFALGPGGHTLYYLTGGRTGKKGHEDLRLVTYDLATSAYRDNGAVRFANGDRVTAVQSIAIGKDGTVYALARLAPSGPSRTDLIAFNGPLKIGVTTW